MKLFFFSMSPLFQGRLFNKSLNRVLDKSFSLRFLALTYIFSLSLGACSVVKPPSYVPLPVPQSTSKLPSSKAAIDPPVSSKKPKQAVIRRFEPDIEHETEHQEEVIEESISPPVVVEQPIEARRRLTVTRPSVNRTSTTAELALLTKAERYHAQASFVQAAAAAERALRINPNSARALYQLAQIRMDQGNNPTAEQLLLKALAYANHNQSTQTVDFKHSVWQTLKNVRLNLGDTAGAAIAEEKMSKTR